MISSCFSEREPAARRRRLLQKFAFTCSTITAEEFESGFLEREGGICIPVSRKRRAAPSPEPTTGGGNRARGSPPRFSLAAMYIMLIPEIRWSRELITSRDYPETINATVRGGAVGAGG